MTTINVISSNGAKWDTILPSQLMFSAHMVVDTRWPGYVNHVGIFLGNCSNSLCGNGYPMLFNVQPMDRDYIHDSNIYFSTARFLSRRLGLSSCPMATKS